MSRSQKKPGQESTVKYPIFKKIGNILPLMFRHVTRKSHFCMISRLMSTLYVVTLALASNQKPVSRSHDPPRPVSRLTSGSDIVYSR